MPVCVVALITARGGSKSIPGKNIAPAGGKPLIAWTIAAALGSRFVQRTLVSTDDEQIADVARRYGAEVPFLRPAELAQDNSPHVPVALHALDWLSRSAGLSPDYLLLLQPTSPLRTSTDIDGAVELALEKGAGSVVSVCETFSHPYLTKTVTADGTLADFVTPPEGYLARQKFPKVYVLNGAIYLIRPALLAEHGSFVAPGSLAYIMPQERSLDVDTPWDLRLVDLVLTANREG